MTGGSAIGAVAVLLWSQVTSLAMLYVAFALIGLALVMSTYDSASQYSSSQPNRTNAIRRSLR